MNDNDQYLFDLWKNPPFIFSLQEALDDKGISRSQLAKALGIDLRSVEDYCFNQVRKINAAYINKICVHLGISPADIIQLRNT